MMIDFLRRDHFQSDYRIIWQVWEHKILLQDSFGNALLLSTAW